jgi:hypothetical protein
MDTLVDGKYSHGAKLHSEKKHRKIHQRRKFVGRDAIPFDWTKPLVRNYTQPIKNQFQAGMCGMELGSQALQQFRNLVLGLPFQEFSEISGYSREHMSPDGMTIGQVADVMAFLGLTLFSEVPTPNNCTEKQAQSIGWQAPALLKNALIRAGLDMVSVEIDIDSIAVAIRDYFFVGFCLGGTNNGTWDSANPQPPVTGTSPQWGHFMCSNPNIPVNPEKIIQMYQSWGSGVGNNGVQNFTEDYINSGFIYDVFTFVKHTFNTNFGIGTINNDVKYLQVRLGIPESTFGFGVFGLRTLSAVKAYQTANGITPTGFVGVLTRAKLNN